MKGWILFCFSLLVLTAQAQEIELKEPIRFLALGDSYTIGQGVPVADRWPVQLAAKLEQYDYNVDELKIIARTGWRTDNLMFGIGSENPSPTYNLVSLLIGVNDQYQGVDISYYPDNFRELLNKAIDLCGGDKSGVFVLSIPDYGYTPFGASNKASISAEIDQYNSINRNIAGELGVTYFDITPISREAEDKPEYLASDRLHPSGLMYAAWVAKIMEGIDLNTSSESNINLQDNWGRLYPNPAKDKVRWEANKPIHSIVFFNAMGKQILQVKANGSMHIDMDVSHLTPGLYFFQIELNNNQLYSGKVIVDNY